jgi:cyclophilin family peptidyl-prolyl cis-trans isomerase
MRFSFLFLLLVTSMSLTSCADSDGSSKNISYEHIIDEQNMTIDLDIKKYQENCSGEGQFRCPKEGDLIAFFETNQGKMDILLFPNEAPNIVKNFQSLANSNYYDGVIFHRVIKDFMIQGGDPTGSGRGGESFGGGVIDDEISEILEYKRGSLAMANRGPNTNGSQFFVIHQDYPLPKLYALFGQTLSGFSAIDTIANTKTEVFDKPANDMIISRLRVYSVTNIRL